MATRPETRTKLLTSKNARHVLVRRSWRSAKEVQLNPISTPLVSQLVRSATSVGANYLEANDAESKKDFRHKIALCRKESKETKHWLRMIVAAEVKHRDSAATLWKEAKELNLIFGAILRRKP